MKMDGFDFNIVDGSGSEEGRPVFSSDEFVSKTKDMLRFIENGYSSFWKIPEYSEDALECTTCGGFLYVCQGGVADLDCPSCDGTGKDLEKVFDAEGFSEFIEHSVMYGNQPFNELIHCIINKPV